MAAITSAPFDKTKDIAAAADMLARRHARDRSRDERLPAQFEDPALCRPMIEEALAAPGAASVIARVDGKPAGFAIMTPYLPSPTHMTANFFMPRSGQVGHSAHAADESVAFDAYREMYAVLAAQFVEQGYFDHLFYVSATDNVLADALVSLGFGRSLTCALRGVEPLDGAKPANVEMHAAGVEDAAIIADLNDDLLRHHSASPIFWAHVHEADAHAQEFQTNLLRQPDANAHWVAYDNGRALGMNTFMAPDWVAAMLTPPKTIYLYQGVVAADARRGGVGAAILSRGIDWAREQGYEHIALHFASPNVSGARFWQSSGFLPVEHRMVRHIDERVIWAR